MSDSANKEKSCSDGRDNSGHLSTGRFTKAKKALLRFFHNPKRLHRKRKKKKRFFPSCFSTGKRGGNGFSGGFFSCIFCFNKPKTLESQSPVESQTSDPNDPMFNFEMLRNFMEVNDFYSKECNTHLNADFDT